MEPTDKKPEAPATYPKNVRVKKAGGYGGGAGGYPPHVRQVRTPPSSASVRVVATQEDDREASHVRAVVLPQRPEGGPPRLIDESTGTGLERLADTNARTVILSFLSAYFGALRRSAASDEPTQATREARERRIRAMESVAYDVLDGKEDEHPLLPPPPGWNPKEWDDLSAEPVESTAPPQEGEPAAPPADPPPVIVPDPPEESAAPISAPPKAGEPATPPVADADPGNMAKAPKKPKK